MLSQLLKGAVAGTMATIPMTAVMAVVAAFVPAQEEDPLPPRQVTRQITSRAGIWQQADHEERMALTTLGHFGFGAATGALYAPLIAPLPLPPVISGVAYGVAVWAASYGGWLPAFNLFRPPTQEPDSTNAQLVLSHIVWGAALGIMVDRLNSSSR